MLRVRVVLTDAENRPTPVSRYALLVSDNPASAAPRRILTALDGTVDLRLRPGSYIVESDRPFALEGRTYQWTQVVDIAAGRDTRLELTAANAETAALDRPATPGPATAGAPGAADADPSALISRWQDSVVPLWAPTARATGFVFDARGLIATSQKVIGKATSVEVQITPNIKVTANVLVSDTARDVAVLRVNPAVVASIRPVPLDCQEPRAAPRVGQTVVAIEAPLRQQKGTTSGGVIRVQSQSLHADLGMASGGTGGPVFASDGRLIGLTSVIDESISELKEDVPISRIGAVCETVAAAEPSVKGNPPPSDARLPLEPRTRFPEEALKETSTRRAGNLFAYQTAATDFDITFLTPVLVYASQDRPRPMRTAGGQATKMVEVAPTLSGPLLDFANWFDYVADVPPVLLVRVTPKFAEPFWARVARGAALSKGIPIPPIKRFRSGFLRMRAMCGGKEVTPIHPFKLERRVSETDAIYEGLYVFDPDALGPGCGGVTLELYSEKAPETGLTHTVEPHVITQYWQDFEPYRAARSRPLPR